MKTASPARFARRSVVALGFAIAAASAAAGPIHHWDFEGDEFPFEDRVGSANGVGGDLVSLVDSGAPAIGQAIAVGAESALPDNGVAVPQAATPSFGTGSFSFAFWIRRIDAENVSSDGILDALAGTTEGYQMLVLDDSEQIRLRLDDSTGAVALLDSAFQFADTAWHHVAITVDRTAAEARFYLDGEFDVARDASAMVGTINASQGLQIGGINAGANGLDGELGDLRIFNHVLTPAEIADLFEPTPLPPTDLLLSASAVSTLAAAGDVAAILSAVDASLSDAHTFSLAAGAGDSDNARFVVEGGTLRFAAPVTEAAGAAFSLRLRVEDSSGLSFEKAVALTAEAPQLILNEFLASNQDGLEDEDGESSDWIELANAGQSHASLAGWSLADGAGEPWVMPARDLAPGGFALVFASGKDRAPDSGEWHASFALSIGGEALELRRPDGSPASAFLPSYPEQRADFSYGVGSGGGIGFLTPTPGAANGAVFPSPPPAVKFRERDPVPPLPGEDLTLVLDASPQGAASVTLHYRINYGPEQEIEMDHAGDIAFSATIPAAEYAAGDMVRWYAVANESLATEVREPPFATAESEAYYGTVVQDPAVATALPVLQWFTQSEAGADSSAGTRASALFRGRFYDNFFCRIRGASSASWPKHKYKFDFNPGERFDWMEGLPAAEEVNLNSHYREVFSQSSNTSYLREPLMFRFLRDAGLPAPETRHIHVRRNGEYFGLFSIVEQIDDRFLKRHGFDADGPMYKAVGVPATLAPNPGPANYRKVLRKDEPFDDLAAFTDGIAETNPGQIAYLLDNVNLPNLLNAMAAMATPMNHDQLTKNYYMYRDPGRGEWFRLPWDVDQAFPVGVYINTDQFRSPLYGDAAHPQGTGSVNPIYRNRLHQAVLDDPRLRELYLRRLRTLADAFLAAESGYFDGLVAGGQALLADEAAADRAAWAAKGVTLSALAAGVAEILETSLPARRDHLFNLYANLVPAAQPPGAAIQFGTVEQNPASGNQDEEFIEFTNPNAFAVDLSGWRLEGGVGFEFPPGSVIPAADVADPGRGKLFVCADVTAFRARAASPTGGEGRIVLGNFSGHLSNFPELLTLLDAAGATVAQITTPDAVSDNQRFLVLSEIMYHPEPDGDAEFIELRNTSDSVTLDLGGAYFSAGVEFTFPGGTMLAPGERILVVRSVAAFEAAHGAGLRIAGEFANGSSLNNAGESVKLDDAGGSTIAEIDYDDRYPWPLPADEGYSLVYISGDPGAAANWRSSAARGGNPGSSDAMPYSGGSLIGYALASPAPWVESADFDFFRYTVNVAADAAAVIPEWSGDLGGWESDALTLVDQIAHGDGTSDMVWRLPRGTAGFVRLRISLRE